MKKIFAFLLTAFLIASLTGKVLAVSYYDNPGQGIFQCHADNNIKPDYIKGGGIIIRWDKLQPVNENTLDQTVLNEYIDILRGSKKYYLHFMIYGENGQPGGVVMPPWLNVYDNDPANDLIGVFREYQGLVYPKPWDSRYQEKLGKFLNLLSSAFEQAGVVDKIEYIEPAAGGIWGSTHLWREDNLLELWVKAAGCPSSDWACLGRKFTEGVNGVVAKYLAAFPQTALMIIAGNCRYSACNYAGYNGLFDKYGMRVMVKEAGLGHRSTDCGLRGGFLGPMCGGSSPQTKCGQEVYGPSYACDHSSDGFSPIYGCGYAKTFEKSLLTEKISYYCLYGTDILCQAVENGRKIDDVNRDVAGKVGTQIYLLSSNLDGSEKNVGSNLKIDFSFDNQGSVALIAPLKQGSKWTPSSYKLFLEFVKDGQVRHYQELVISPGTNTWVPVNFSKEVSFSVNLNVSESLGGASQNSRVEYKVYAGLTDPNGGKNRFAFRNSEAKNDLVNRRYLINDSFFVLGRGVPTSTPGSPTNTPVPAGLQIGDCPAVKPSRSLGNANCDDKIDQGDFSIWKEEFLGTKTTKTADFNEDGKVDGVDYIIWWRNRE